MIILPLALSIVRVHLSVLKHTVMWYRCLEIGCNSTSTESQKGNPLILCNLTTHNIYTVHVYLLLCCPTHVQYYPGHQWRNHSVQIHGSCPWWLMDLTHRQVIVYTTPVVMDCDTGPAGYTMPCMSIEYVHLNHYIIIASSQLVRSVLLSQHTCTLAV